MDEVAAGDLCALSGIADIKIGETICLKESPISLPSIKVGGIHNRPHGISDYVTPRLWGTCAELN